MSLAVVAIDGPAGSGKSTTARAVADQLGLAHLDSGALYRAITLAALDAGISLTAEPVLGLASMLPVRLELVDQVFRPAIAGVDVSGRIRSDAVNRSVSEIAAMPAVRAWVNRALRSAAALHPRGVVSDGRDIGSVVLPDAGLKIFLTASVRERASRRAREVAPGAATGAPPLDLVEQEIAERDRKDSSRSDAPLALTAAQAAPGSVWLDTTGLTFQEQVTQIVGLARKAFGWLDIHHVQP